MHAYQQILLTTDFSQFSQNIARKAMCLAGHFNSEITLLHVVEKYLEDENLGQISAEENESSRGNSDWEQGNSRLVEFIHSIENFSPIPLVVIAEGTAEEEISRVSREIRADLIIIGAYGENGVSLLPTYDVEAVKKKVSCDVLVVHTGSV